MSKLRLQGFNSLTKTLSFNLYDIGYAAKPAQQDRYLAYIDEAYNTERLTQILTTVSRIIGASILNPLDMGRDFRDLFGAGGEQHGFTEIPLEADGSFLLDVMMAEAIRPAA